MNELARLTDISIKNGGTELTIDVVGIEKNILKAKRYFTGQVGADCTNHVPFRQGPLRESICYPEGLEGGIIEWTPPYAHYMYMGVKYVNPDTGYSGYEGSDGMWGGWSGEKIPTSQKLHYYTEGTGDHWLERAAEAHGNEWMEGVKKIMTGG